MAETEVIGDSFDVAVVGGGLVGSAIAWGLARSNRRIVLLDEGDRAFRASRGNFALVWVQGKGLGMPEYAGWTRRSSDAWAGFADILGAESDLDLAFRRPGGLQLALSEAELDRRASSLNRLHNQPNGYRFEFEILDRNQVARLLPEVGPEVVGASYCPHDGHVNSLRLFRALHTALTRRRVSYRPNWTVDRIVPDAGGFRLMAAAGTVTAAQVVVAAGNGNARLAPMVGLSAPVRPQRGHIVVTERAEPFLDYPMTTIRQTDEGSIMMGDSSEEAGFDTTASVGVASVIAQRAVRMFPRLAGLNVVRSWAALRVMTPDGFPIYEQSAAHPGAFLATCHSGVTLAANHALVLAPLIAAGSLPSDTFAPFSARRFNVPPPA